MRVPLCHIKQGVGGALSFKHCEEQHSHYDVTGFLWIDPEGTQTLKRHLKHADGHLYLGPCLAVSQVVFGLWHRLRSKVGCSYVRHTRVPSIPPKIAIVMSCKCIISLLQKDKNP